MRALTPNVVSLMVTWRRLRASRVMRTAVAAMVVSAVSIVPILWLTAAVLGRIPFVGGCVTIAGIGPCP
jgi:hypothetical protein